MNRQNTTRFSLLLPLCATLTIVTAGQPVLASGFHNEDFGVRRMGMFAVTARPDDGTAVFHNPAGLVLQEGNRFYTSQSWFFLDLGLRLYDSQGQLHPEENLGPDWNIGILPFFSFSTDLGLENLRFGLAVYAPNAYGASMSDDAPTRYHVTDALFIGSRATATVAWKIDEHIAIAGSINLVHTYLTLTKYMNPLVLQDPDHRFDDPAELAPLDSLLELDGQDWTWAIDLGLLLHPVEELRIGLAFFGGSPVDLTGDVTLTDASGAVQSTTHHTGMVIPFTVRAGINWEFVPNWEIAADVRYYHYQVFQEQRTELDGSLFGLTEMVDPKNYTNSVNWCIGMLYRVLPELELMVGYQEDKTPIPPETFTLENPSRDQRGFGLGARWQALEQHRFGLAFVRNWFDLVDIQESIGSPPSNAKGYAGNTEFGLDYTFTF